MKVYILNESGVFQNPEILEYGVKNTAVKIQTAFANNNWYMGYDVITSTQGIGIPVFISKHEYKTQHEAMKTGKEMASNYLKNMLNDKYAVGKDKIKSLIKIIESPDQGVLF